MIQQKTLYNIPATVMVRWNGGNIQVLIRYEHINNLIENDESAIWTQKYLILKDTRYGYGTWGNLNEELKQYLNSYMKYQ